MESTIKAHIEHIDLTMPPIRYDTISSHKWSETWNKNMYKWKDEMRNNVENELGDFKSACQSDQVRKMEAYSQTL